MRHPITGPVAIVAAAFLLSGCDELFNDDGSSAPTDTDPPPVDITTGAGYDDQIITTLDLMTALEGSSITPSDQIPTSGSVGYTGVVGFSEEAPGDILTYDMMADLSLQADFGTGAVTGTMDNFNTRDDVDMNGSLTLTEGQVAGTGFTANAIGAFTDGTTAEIWDLDVNADFVGAGGSGIMGTATGTISNGGSETRDVFGDIVAQQD